MIIKIPDSWLREYLDTKATPEEIREYLTLSGPTVEALEKLSADTVYTIEITPNRTDLLSVYGLAREAQAILTRYAIKATLKELLSEKELPERMTSHKLPLRSEIKDKSLCPYFLAIVLNNLRIDISPKFMRDRLEKSGFRAINNVVDISNYVMIETGQPLHIFDYDKVEGNLMRLRESQKGEQITTLDGIKREIPEGSIIIEDREKIIDLCGIMGGKNSEVSQTTTSAVLFAQIYEPTKIRRTYRSLNLITEAALRFEKGVDPEMLKVAFNRALGLLKRYAQARISSNAINISNQEFKPKMVPLSISQLQDYLGERMSIEQASEYLRSLGFEVTITTESFEPPKILTKVPSFRDTDINIAEDLIEEVARLHGYHKLPETLPTGPIPNDTQEMSFYWEAAAKNILKYASFFEVYNYSFISEKLLKKSFTSSDEALKLKNPLNLDFEYLRTSLLPSLLQNLSDNRAFAEDIRLFELERVYKKSETQKLPQEPFHLSAVLYKDETKRTEGDIFYELKGILEMLFTEFGVSEYKFVPYKGNTFWHPGRSAEIFIGNPAPVKEALGIIGEIQPKVTENFKLKGRAVAVDIKFDDLIKAASRIKPFIPIIDHPPLIEDISLIVEKKVLSEKIKEAIFEVLTSSEKLDLKPSKVETIDIYEGRDLPKEKKSLTFRIYYQQIEKPLGSKDITPLRDELFRSLEEKFEAKIRRLQI